MKTGIGLGSASRLNPPTFEVFAKRYKAEDTAHLANTTRRDRESYLRKDGPLLGFFGQLPLDEIDAALIRLWWNQEVAAAERSPKTGKCYLDVLSAVLGYAVELNLLAENPVPAFRVTLRKRSSALVLGDLDPDKFRAHEWRRIVTRARLAHRPLKDLRDSSHPSSSPQVSSSATSRRSSATRT